MLDRENIFFLKKIISDEFDVIFVDEDPSVAGASATNYTNNTIKIELVDDAQLKSVIDHINEQNDASTIVVRPWIDNVDRKFSNDTISQFALYKCMSEKCLFATDSMKQWQTHMNSHHQLIGYFERQHLLDKSTRDRLIKFRQCSYCEFQAKADQQIIWHMEEEHRRSIFQCANCFYRTIEIDNMVLHMQIYHPGNDEILLCSESRGFDQQDQEILEQDCGAYVKKIRCDQGDKFI